MKYTTEIRINLPREQVISLFDSVENMYQWQEGLKSIDLLEGEAMQEGCRSKLVYAGRKGDLVMTETITLRKYPDEFHAVYQAKGVYNEMYNYFSEEGPDATLWKTISVFRFKGLMALMAPFMKGAFTSNTTLSMERFKHFAENKAKK